MWRWTSLSYGLILKINLNTFMPKGPPKVYKTVNCDYTNNELQTKELSFCRTLHLFVD